MTSFNIFDFNSFVNNNNNVFNALKSQRNLQAHCDFRASSVRSASNISISRFFLQSIFFNKHAIIDFVSFSLFSIKRIRLTSFVRNIRDRKPSTFYVSATSSVNIRSIQTVTIRCESLKKKRNRFSKIKADFSQHKSNVAEKKRKNRSVKSNVASFNKEKNNSSIKRKTVDEMKNVKSIRFETMKKKKTRKKSDKMYRHARQRVRTLRKNDTSSNSLFATFFASTSALTFSAYRKCDFCHKYKSLFQFLFSDFNEEFRSMCLHCFIDDINNLNEIEWCWIENHETLCFDFVFNDRKHAFCKKCDNVRRHDRVSHTFSSVTESKSLEISTVSSKNWNLITNFYTKFEKMKRTVCEICNERRFNMKLKQLKKQFMCDRCWRDVKKYSEKIVTWNAQNDMNSQSIFKHLSQLIIAEKLLIVRVHVMMNSRRVKKCQYKYFDHVINFMQNIVKIVNRFLFLSIEIQIMILKFSFNDVKNSKTHRRFEENFRVRREHVEIWFKYLIEHHFDYKELSIDVDKLSQLFVNDSIFNQLTTHEKLNESAEKNQKISLNMLSLRRQVVAQWCWRRRRRFRWIRRRWKNVSDCRFLRFECHHSHHRKIASEKRNWSRKIRF